MLLSTLFATESAIGPTLAIIVGVGMAAQWLAWRSQVPSIVLLLIAGLVLGPVFSLIDPDEFLGGTLFPVVSLSVALILFEGGLDLPPRELRSTGTVVRRLISVGAIITFLVAAWGAEHMFDMSRGAAAVMAAVLVVTGPTVVGPLLRFVRPSGRTGPMLRAEGILIDPIGATAALVAFEVALTDEPGDAITTVFGVIGTTLLVGIGIGLVLSFVLDHALRRFLIPDHLANPIALAIVIVGFVLSNEVQEEAGLLTVTVMGIWLARRDSAAVRQLLEFNESLRTLLISVLFILLAARIEPDQLRDVALPSLLFLALLVFVARPLGVIVSTVRTGLSWRERLFLMVMAPRGIVAAAVSAIFALRLEEEGIRGAELIVPIVFLVIIGTILVYGFLAGPIANALGLAEARANGVLIVGAHAVARGLAKALNDLEVKAMLVDTDPYNVTRSVALGLPARTSQRLDRGGDPRTRPARHRPDSCAHVERRGQRLGVGSVREGVRSTRNVPAGTQRKAPGGGDARGVARTHHRDRGPRLRHARRARPSGLAGSDRSGGRLDRGDDRGRELPADGTCVRGPAQFHLQERSGADPGHGDRARFAIAATGPRQGS